MRNAWGMWKGEQGFETQSRVRGRPVGRGNKGVATKDPRCEIRPCVGLEPKLVWSWQEDLGMARGRRAEEGGKTTMARRSHLHCEAEPCSSCLGKVYVLRVACAALVVTLLMNEPVVREMSAPYKEPCCYNQLTSNGQQTQKTLQQHA